MAISRGLSPKQVEAFQTSGFVIARGVLAPRVCDDFRAQADAFEAAHPRDACWAFDIKANLLFDWVYALSIQPVLLDVIETLIGPDILLTNSILRIKEPGSATQYGWHQDGARIQVYPPFVIAYLAIGPASTENGCLRVIPGTHHQIAPFHLIDYPDRQVARVDEVDETRAVDLELAQGDVAVFHGNAVHGSNPNLSGERRFALLNDYTPTCARQSLGEGSGQLVRGVDRFGNFAAEPVPTGSCTSESILARRRILRSYPENPLMGPLAPGARSGFADAPGAL